MELEVGERLDAEGAVLEPLDVGEVRAAVRRLRDEGVEAVCSAFSHSYLNPTHERAAAAIVREEMPERGCRCRRRYARSSASTCVAAPPR